jgi:hypothetical protein
MPVRVRINQVEVARMMRSPDGPVVRHIEVLTRRTLNQGKRNVRVDEGTLRASLHQQVTVSADEVRGRVDTPLEYGLYLELGTGLFGPKKQVIRPVRAKALRFEVKGKKPVRGKGSRPVVFARYVRGVEGDRWLTRALEAVSPYPVRRLI